jgi:lipopolysaccharide/colanic/teichoic acid biosynthesis glycosyltransferase
MPQPSGARLPALNDPPSRYDAAKRMLDVVLAIVLLVVSLPLFVFLAAVIKLNSPGPVFYRGVRVGRHGRLFRQWKFRTMVVDAERLGGAKTCTRDERITGIGRRLRSTKLDELPQLFNVLCGDMSLVGPRPMVPEEVERYTPFEQAALSVRPGVTDWASIWFHNEERELAAAENLNHYYETHIRPEKARLRTAYVHSRSLGVDISIVAQTAFVLLRTRLDSTEELHSHRPIRLWGHRPTRVAMAVGLGDGVRSFALSGYNAAVDALPPVHDAGERVVMREA